MTLSDIVHNSCGMTSILVRNETCTLISVAEPHGVGQQFEICYQGNSNGS